jgi:hypothetical protein
MKHIISYILLVMLVGCSKPLDPEVKVACAQLAGEMGTYIRMLQKRDITGVQEQLKHIESEWKLLSPKLPSSKEKMLYDNSIRLQQLIFLTQPYMRNESIESSIRQAEAKALHSQLNPKYLSILREEAVSRNSSEQTLNMIDELKNNPLVFHEKGALQNPNTLAEIMGVNIETGTKGLLKIVVND